MKPLFPFIKLFSKKSFKHKTPYCINGLYVIKENGDIKIYCAIPYHTPTLEIIRQLPDRRYLSNLRMWSAPFTREAICILEKLELPSCVYKRLYALKEMPHSTLISTIGTMDKHISNNDHTDISDQTNESEHSLTSHTDVLETEDIPDKSKKTGRVDVSLRGDYFEVRMPYHPDRVRHIKSIKGAYWMRSDKKWRVKADLNALYKIQEFFSLWSIDEYSVLQDELMNRPKSCIVTLYATPEYSKHIIIKPEGECMDIEFLKSLPGRRYDHVFKRWIVPHDSAIIDRVIEHFSQKGIHIQNKLTEVNRCHNQSKSINKEIRAYFLNKYKAYLRYDIETYIDAMVQMRYSQNTLRLYLSELVKCINYFDGQPLGLLSHKAINSYLADIAGAGVSDSKLNAAVNAIKFYYNHVRYTDTVNIEYVRRPRKSKRLPQVLSIKEVDRLLQAVDNLKHVAMLYTLYSSGIRVSELLALRTSDVDWARNHIFIQDAKGRKDRYVIMSKTLKELLRFYFDQYHPQAYLFEGQEIDSPYSARSVQSIVKRAARKAGISKKVTPHTLRHCFATHLADSGVGLNIIKELLGHKDIKTTMVYTHVSTHNLGQIESPLDRLKIKTTNKWDTKTKV